MTPGGRTLGLAAGLAWPAAAWAQEPTPTRPPNPDVRPTSPAPAPPTRADSADARRDGERPPVACRGQRVSDVVVLSQPPLGNRLLGRFRWAQRQATALHSTTRDRVVRRFLLLNPGDACDELRRSESERILRAQPFLVDARVLPYDDGNGGVRLEVETRDEFSAIVGLAALGRNRAPVSVVRLGEANFMGQGVYVSGQWSDHGPGYRDGYVLRLTDYQFLGRPYQLAALAESRRVGHQWSVDASHPYYTDLQRFAWRVAGGDSRDVLEMIRPEEVRNSLFYKRSYANVGGLLRIGTPGRLSLFGASVSYEAARTEDQVQVLSDSGPVPDVFGRPVGFTPSDRFQRQRVTRANALWGVRAVNFQRVVGFDALTGVQDVRRGFQAGVLLGRSVQLLGTRDDDYYVSGDVYGGVGGQRSFLGLEAHGEVRHDNVLDAWRGFVSGGRAAWYVVPDGRWRFVTSGTFSGAWRARVPMQLPLGERDGGVRGYLGARESGSGRLAARAESRYVLGRLGNAGDLGLAAFVDAGKLWAGDVPYGVTTPVRTSVGIGALGAFPRGSRRLWRVDVAKPLARVPGAPAVQVIFENRDLTRLFWREPRDLQWGRERALPENVFTWP